MDISSPRTDMEVVDPRKGSETALLHSPLLAALAAIGLGLSSSPPATFTLLALLVVGLELYPQLRTVAIAYASLIIGTTLAYLLTLNNLNVDRGLAILSLFVFAAYISLWPIAAVGMVLQVARDLGLSRYLAFPIVWTASWALAERASRFGRYGSWTIEAPSWLEEGLGVTIANEIWLAIGAQALAGVMLLWADRKYARRSRIGLYTLLALYLLFLIPSKSFDAQGLDVAAACISPKQPFTLEKLLHDTRQAASRGAKVVLWPEGAVTVMTSEGEEGLQADLARTARLSNIILGAAYVGPTGDGHRLLNMLSIN